MAIQVSTTLFPDNTTANFRAWVQFINDMLSAAGFVQTADTGQIASIAAMAAPVAPATASGYQVWRFADSLQATAPIFFKIEYGSGGTTTTPRVWMTIGTGSSGAGVITGLLVLRNTIESVPSTANTYTSFASGAGGSRIAIGLFNRTDGTISPIFTLIFGVERSKDSTGADSGEGLIYTTAAGSSGPPVLAFVPFSGLTPAADSIFRTLHPAGSSSSAVGADVYMFPIYPMNIIPKNPELNFMLYFGSDYVGLTPATNVSIYGSNHAYVPLVTAVNSAVAPINNNLRIAMRYE